MFAYPVTVLVLCCLLHIVAYH